MVVDQFQPLKMFEWQVNYWTQGGVVANLVIAQKVLLGVGVDTRDAGFVWQVQAEPKLRVLDRRVLLGFFVILPMVWVQVAFHLLHEEIAP